MSHVETFIRVGDTTLFRSTIVNEDGAAVDVATATTLLLRFQKPDGTTVDHTAVLGAGTGVIEYQAVTADLDAIGDWNQQGIVDLPGPPPMHYSSNIEPFPVAGVLPAPP